jgi:adenylate cyclase
MQEIDKHDLVENILSAVLRRFSATEYTKLASKLRNEALNREIYSLLDGLGDDNYISEQKQVTILLSDLRGFTAMSERNSAADLIDLLNRYFHKMSEIILRYNGTIDKFMGDSVMALFGAPSSRDDDLERAIACAVEMQLAMNEINATNEKLGLPTIYMGIGINTGTVFAGNLGSDLHSEYTVIGNEVNLTSRVEAHSLRGQVMLSENSYQLAKDYIGIGTINDVLVKGVSNNVRLYELLYTERPKKLEVPQREIRKSARVDVDMPLSFRIVDKKTVRADEYEGRIKDVSYNGMMAVMTTQLEPNTEIKINFSLSMMSNRVSEVYARALKVRELDGQYQCQLEFTFIEDQAQRELKEFVDQVVEFNR